MAASAPRIGIEIEFFVAQPLPNSTPKKGQGLSKDDRWPNEQFPQAPSDHATWDYPGKRCMVKICDSLAQVNLPVACPYPSNIIPRDPVFEGSSALNNQILTLEPPTMFRCWNSHLAQNRGTQSEKHQYYLVTREITNTKEQVNGLAKALPEDYDWYCVEISTPIIPEREVNANLPLLASALSKIQQNIKISQNSFCGLHIHASPGGNKQLDYITAKKAIALVALLEEPLLNVLCHPSRHENSYSPSIRTSSQIASEG